MSTGALNANDEILLNEIKQSIENVKKDDRVDICESEWIT